MDPIDILGGLLGGGGGNSGGGSLGGKILKDLLGGGRKPAPPTQRAPTSGRGPSGGPIGSGRPVDIDRQAKELEDLLGVARDRYSGRSNSPAPAPQQRQAPPVQPQSRPEIQDRGRSRTGSTGGFTFDDRPPVGRREPLDTNEEALVLIRAMINAAKSDGRVTQAEQQEIMQRISNPTQDAINFLREEFARPVDVREFAWSVPLGMEQKVYTISLAAVDVDTQAEATYLKDLAHGLRLEPELCNQLHQQYGAPALY